MIDAVTDATFAVDVVAATTPVLVELGASWCPPCRTMAPVLAEIAREREGSLRVVTVDSDANPKVVERFGGMSVPTPSSSREASRSAGSWATAPSRSCFASWTRRSRSTSRLADGEARTRSPRQSATILATNGESPPPALRGHPDPQ